MSDFRFITSDNIPLDTSTNSDVYVEGQPLIYFSREQYIKLCCLTFSSPEPFTLAIANATKNWNGTLEYSINRSTWTMWDGTTTLSSSGNKLYLRGTGNSRITGNFSSYPSSYRWILTGSNISCIGNIENLLDYQIVARGEHPTMADDCYNGMFQDCTSLTTAPVLPATILTNMCYANMFYRCRSLTSAPALPATTLANHCYVNMFYECISLAAVPELPATTLTAYCYAAMFSSCSLIKLSTTQTGEYQIPYKIPSSGTGTTGMGSLIDMFFSTGGTFTGAPEINTTYYLSTSNSIIPAN